MNLKQNKLSVNEFIPNNALRHYQIIFSQFLQTIYLMFSCCIFIFSKSYSKLVKKSIIEVFMCK